MKQKDTKRNKIAQESMKLIGKGQYIKKHTLLNYWENGGYIFNSSIRGKSQSIKNNYKQNYVNEYTIKMDAKCDISNR